MYTTYKQHCVESSDCICPLCYLQLGTQKIMKHQLLSGIGRGWPFISGGHFFFFFYRHRNTQRSGTIALACLPASSRPTAGARVGGWGQLGSVSGPMYKKEIDRKVSHGFGCKVVLQSEAPLVLPSPLPLPGTWCQ